VLSFTKSFTNPPAAVYGHLLTEKVHLRVAEGVEEGVDGQM